MKRFLAMVLAIALMGLGAAASAEAFKVGMECNYAPFNWTQVDGANDAVAINGGGGYAGGYDVEMAKKIADGLGRELEIVKIEWDGLIPALNAGMIDAVIAGMSPTEERKITVDFSQPYYTSDLVVVVKKGGAYEAAKTLADFAGARITAQLNTFHYTVIDQLTGANKLPAMESFPTMMVALTSGVIDGYISERPGAVSACAADSSLTFVSFEEGFVTRQEDTAVSVAVRKGDTELAQAIDAVLETVDSQTRQQMMDAAVASQPLSE